MDDETKELLKKNNEMLEEILRISKKTKTYIITQQVFGVLKILIIAIPIVLGIIYLPAILNDLMKPYQELLGISQELDGTSNIDPALLNKVTPDLLKKYMK